MLFLLSYNEFFSLAGSYVVEWTSNILQIILVIS